MTLDKETILKALKPVKDPELHDSLVDLGMIQEIEIEGNRVTVTVGLTMAGCPFKGQIKEDVLRAVQAIPDVEEAKVILTTMTTSQRARIFGQSPSVLKGLKGVERVIAVASGKGGVGKSTVAVNLAAAMMKLGRSVGILDADMHGPDIPMMLGATKERPTGAGGMLEPVERHGIRLMSTGLLAGDGEPIVWRGPLVNKAIREFLAHVSWGDLDYLVVDLPPGTGDAPLSLAGTTPLAGVVMVTTPQKVALADVRRSFGLFRQHGIQILGVVENMSFLRLPGQGEISVFGSGGGKKVADAFGIPLLARIPLDPEIAACGDSGRPIALNDQSPAAQVFRELAEKVMELTKK